MTSKLSVLRFAGFCGTLALSASFAFAQVGIDTVFVGYAGNAADPGTGGLYGAVAYDYRIGTTEVTNAQYATFLNTTATTDSFGLYNTEMGSDVRFGGITRSGSSGSYTYATKTGYANTPVNYVSFWDSARFANWLNNGQGTGSTETGAYTLNSFTNPTNASVTRNSGASVWIASENEWYKAAYYQPASMGGDADNYWLHATQSNTLGGNTPFTLANGANYYDGDYALYTDSNNGAAPVGSYTNADSFFGTFDQGGNVWEWNDTILSSDYRGLRGGSWISSEDGLRASGRDYGGPADDGVSVGFRVASLTPIPEPSTYAALAGLVTLGYAAMRRRRA